MAPVRELKVVAEQPPVTGVMDLGPDAIWEAHLK